MSRLSPTRAARRIGGRLRDGARRLRPLFERRKSGRVKADRAVSCNLGSVVDFSSSGMRIRSKRRLGGIVSLDLSTSSSRLRFNCEVIWSKRLGFRRYMSGLQFCETTPALSRQLSNINSVL